MDEVNEACLKTRLRASVRDENGRAMPSEHARPQAGAQANPALGGGEPRANPALAHKTSNTYSALSSGLSLNKFLYNESSSSFANCIAIG
jgi:hypothetical protein